MRTGIHLFRFPIRLLLLVVTLTALYNANGQSYTSNIRVRLVNAHVAEQVLDSLTILSPLLFIADTAHGCPLPARLFTLQNNKIRIDTAAVQRICPGASVLQVTYRVLGLNLGKPVFRLDTALIKRGGRADDVAFDYSPYDNTAANPFAAPGVVSTGTYTRGISFGNSQNLVFNSNLNLQLEGKLGNDLIIRGALSDNSIPLQPDGTTRRLQEFDRIFIELERKGVIVSAGDLDFTRPAGYFSNYFKRMQGAKVVVPAGKRQPAVSVGAGISKGKFNRQIVQGQEGNQGPYRLVGAEGERFIIVLAGTEKVYVDGQLLQRGQADDYVIDYNLGEIIFTQKRLITKDIRIIIEFEYAVQNYLRSTVTARTEWPFKKGRTWINIYSEQDGLNATGNLDLSPNERARLAQAGDDLRNAFASGIDTLTQFETSRVLYQYRDTVICGIALPVLEFSTNPAQALYAARFSEVPIGQGNYVQAPNSANGRVYKWVAPDPVTCVPTGNFEPVVRLIAPEQRQLHTVGGEYGWNTKNQLFAEATLSKRDLNRFSPLNDGNNFGGGGFLRWQNRRVKGVWTSLLDANTEWISAQFLPLNPYRPAEFARDWNTGLINPLPAAERMIKGAITLQRKNWGEGHYEWANFNRTNQYDGQKHLVKMVVQNHGWGLIGEWNELQSSGSVEQTRFSRPKFDVSKSFEKDKTQVLKMGIYAEREKNTRRNIATDTLQRNGFWYDMARFYVQMPATTRAFTAGAYLSQRNDFAPLSNGFRQNTSANDVNINGRFDHGGNKALKKPPPGTLEWNFTWRQLRITDQELTDQKAQSTYLGRLDYRFSALKNGITSTTGYEIGSGQSPKVEFNYVRVNPGDGAYSWIDRNRDSILQVDEMEIAVFQDQASYVRVAVTTPQYIRTNNVVFNQNIRLEPRLWVKANAKGWRKWASKTAAQSTLQINRRVLADAVNLSPWNPFQLNIADSVLVTVNSTVRHVLFLNRADPRWDASLAYGNNRSRILVTTGFESRQLGDQTVHVRASLSQQWSIETDFINSYRTNETENFANRNYNIQGLEIAPKITWQPLRNFRLTSKLSWKDRQNTGITGEKSRQSDINAELTWNPTAKPKAAGGFSAATSLRSKFTLANIKYEGTANTPVAFAMLEGLQNGRNYLWNFTLDRQLSKSVQMNLTYEGRRTGTSKRVVHVARAQVRAIF